MRYNAHIGQCVSCKLSAQLITTQWIHWCNHHPGQKHCQLSGSPFCHSVTPPISRLLVLPVFRLWSEMKPCSFVSSSFHSTLCLWYFSKFLHVGSSSLCTEILLSDYITMYSFYWWWNLGYFHFDCCKHSCRYFWCTCYKYFCLYLGMNKVHEWSV